MIKDRTGLVVATAVSLYAYNVSPAVRARRLYNHFKGASADLDELLAILTYRGEFAATELAAPTALLYVRHALERYGDEAAERVRVNLGDEL